MKLKIAFFIEAVNTRNGNTSGSYLIDEKTLTQSGKDTLQIVASDHEPQTDQINLYLFLIWLETIC